jgi:hypothetical protein
MCVVSCGFVGVLFTHKPSVRHAILLADVSLFCQINSTFLSKAKKALN